MGTLSSLQQLRSQTLSSSFPTPASPKPPSWLATALLVHPVLYGLSAASLLGLLSLFSSHPRPRIAFSSLDFQPELAQGHSLLDVSPKVLLSSETRLIPRLLSTSFPSSLSFSCSHLLFACVLIHMHYMHLYHKHHRMTVTCHVGCGESPGSLAWCHSPSGSLLLQEVCLIGDELGMVGLLALSADTFSAR